MDYQAKFRGAVSRFLDDATETAYDGQISVKELFERWEEWCRDHNRFPGNLIAFGKELAARGEERKHTRIGHAVIGRKWREELA
jgi:phage/plasmid-associated DNA primase